MYSLDRKTKNQPGWKLLSPLYPDLLWLNYPDWRSVFKSEKTPAFICGRLFSLFENLSSLFYT